MLIKTVLLLAASVALTSATDCDNAVAEIDAMVERTTCEADAGVANTGFTTMPDDATKKLMCDSVACGVVMESYVAMAASSGCAPPSDSILASMAPSFLSDCIQLQKPSPHEQPSADGDSPEEPPIPGGTCDAHKLSAALESDDGAECASTTGFSFSDTQDTPDSSVKFLICKSTACLKVVVALREVDLLSCTPPAKFAMVRQLLASINEDCDRLVLESRFS